MEEAKRAEQVAEEAADLSVAAAVAARIDLRTVEVLLSRIGQRSNTLRSASPQLFRCHLSRECTSTPQQAQVALDYDALRFLLGREGGAPIVFYSTERVHDERDALAITIEAGDVDDDNWIVVYGRSPKFEEGPCAELGRAQYSPELRGAVLPISGLSVIDRLEIQDASNRPVRLGLPFAAPGTGERTSRRSIMFRTLARLLNNWPAQANAAYNPSVFEYLPVPAQPVARIGVDLGWERGPSVATASGIATVPRQ